MKIFDRPDSEIGRVTRINENLWFEVMQPQLLRLANTDYGKDLLCIPKGYRKIFKIGKNHIFHSPRMENGKIFYDWDFRVGAKWANVIRSRWEEIMGVLLWQDANRFILPAVRSRVLVSAAFGGPYYPDPDPETTSMDGYVANTEVVWATARDAADGDDTDSASGFTLETAATSSAGYLVSRGFFLFDTSAIPDGDTLNPPTIFLGRDWNGRREYRHNGLASCCINASFKYCSCSRRFRPNGQYEFWIKECRGLESNRWNV